MDKQTELRPVFEEFPESHLNFARDRLTPERWSHTQNVLQNSRALLEVYPELREPRMEFLTAVLLHDLAKDLDRSRQRKLASRYRGELDEYERNLPAIWHGPAGAQLLVEKALVPTDSPILKTISYHSTGVVPMSEQLMGLIVADFSAADRNFSGAREIRTQYGEVSLERLANQVLSYKITICLQKNKIIHPNTVEAYNTTCD